MSTPTPKLATDLLGQCYALPKRSLFLVGRTVPETLLKRLHETCISWTIEQRQIVAELMCLWAKTHIDDVWRYNPHHSKALLRRANLLTSWAYAPGTTQSRGRGVGRYNRTSKCALITYAGVLQELCGQGQQALESYKCAVGLCRSTSTTAISIDLVVARMLRARLRFTMDDKHQYIAASLKKIEGYYRDYQGEAIKYYSVLAASWLVDINQKLGFATKWLEEDICRSGLPAKPLTLERQDLGAVLHYALGAEARDF